jgi:hypothetical protein
LQRFIKRLGRDENSPWMQLPAGRRKVIFVIRLERRFAEFIQQRLTPTVRPWLESFSTFFFVFPHRISLTEQLLLGCLLRKM